MASSLNGKSARQLNSDAAIDISDVYEHFRLYHERSKSLKHALLKFGRNNYEDFWVLQGVSLQISKGDTFALIGENGSGKSTLLKCIARVLEPTKGAITVNGRVSALLELGAGFHEDLTGRENIYLNGAILGCSKQEMDGIFDDIVQFAELEQFIDIPVRNYSSGMYVRLGFAVAVHLDFDILLVDEVLAVGDMAFQAKCSRKIDEFKSQGRTIVLVSHNLEQVRRICNKAAWLENGKVLSAGNAGDVLGAYLSRVREKEEEKLHQASDKFRKASEPGIGDALAIKGVTILDGEGNTRTTFTTGEQMVVEVEFETTGTIDRPDFGVSIWTSAGFLVGADSSKFLDEALVDSLQGEGVYKYVIPELPLLPGDYLLTTSVFDKNDQRYDASVWRNEFKVIKGDKPQPPGLFELQGHWGLSVKEYR